MSEHPKELKSLKRIVQQEGQKFSAADKEFEPLEKLGWIECYDCMWGRYYYELTSKGKSMVFK